MPLPAQQPAAAGGRAEPGRAVPPQPARHARKSAIAAWPNAGITPVRSTSASEPWPASARRNTTRSCAGRCTRPRRCWRSTRSRRPCSSHTPGACGSSLGHRRGKVSLAGPGGRGLKPRTRPRRAGSGDPRQRRARANAGRSPGEPARCSWRPWPVSSSRGFMSRTRRAECCARLVPTSSWW